MSTILVIEDDAAVRRGVVDALEFAGHEVLEAGDGNDRHAAGADGELPVLLLDWCCPGRRVSISWRPCASSVPGQAVIICRPAARRRTA